MLKFKKRAKLILSFTLAIMLIFPCFKADALSAASAVLICADTGEILYSKNAEDRLAMASTTKIMTALLLCENVSLDKSVTVTAEQIRVEGTSMGLRAGDKVTAEDLLYGMLLTSGNDAANVAAYAVSGSTEKFVELMNKKAESLKLKNTHFATPSGLDAEDHFSTAFDMAMLARYALLNEDFAKAAAQKQKTVTINDGTKKLYLVNHNRLLRTYDDVTGVKTGFTKKAGRCLVSSAEKNKKRVIAVTLNDPDDWADHRKMLDLGLEAVSVQSVEPPIKNLRVNVIGGNKKSLCIPLKGHELCSAAKAELTCKIETKQTVFAPVKKGDEIGVINFYSDGILIKKTKILADESIERKKDNGFKNYFDFLIFMFGRI